MSEERCKEQKHELTVIDNTKAYLTNWLSAARKGVFVDHIMLDRLEEFTETLEGTDERGSSEADRLA